MFDITKKIELPKENKKSTEIEKSNRVAIIFEAMCKGVTERDMLQHTSKLENWNVTPRQVDTYISEAKKLFKTEAAKDIQEQFGKAIIRLEMLFQKSLEIQD